MFYFSNEFIEEWGLRWTKGVQRTHQGSHQGSGDLLLGTSCREVVYFSFHFIQFYIKDSSESSWSGVAVS